MRKERPFDPSYVDRSLMAVSKRLRYEIFRRDNHTCRYCGSSAPDVKITVDHVLPTALGGTDTPENLVTACSDCNSGKTSTTPDAPLVANVAEDAIRWAGAMALAAQEALEDTQNREKTYKAFQKAWKKNGGEASDLPANWRGSLNSLIAAGLPPEALTECVDIAFDQTHVYDRNRFKYMCGVGWRKVDKLRERAEQIVGVQRTPESSLQEEEGDEFTPKTVLEACKELLEENFDEDQREDYLDRIRAEEGSDYPEVSLHYFALSRALSETVVDLAALQQTVHRFMSLYRDDAVEWSMDASRHMHQHYLGTDFTMASVLSQAVDILTEPQHAMKTIKSLPEEERQKWLEIARADLEEGTPESQVIVQAMRLRRDANRPDTTGPAPF